MADSKENTDDKKKTDVKKKTDSKKKTDVKKKTDKPRKAVKVPARERELKQLEDRFREHQKSQQGQSQGAEVERKGRKAFLKVAILAILLALALVLALYPRFKKQQKDENVPLPHPEMVEPFGNEAMVPKGCREVHKASYAILTDLPKGSKTAQQQQRDFAKEKKLPVEIENSIGMRFRLVPAPVTFTIGSPAAEIDRGPDEEQHTASLRANLYVGKFEVTQEQFAAVMNFNPSYSRGPKLPVEEVSWFHAMKFCENLCKQEGVPVGSYTLPSEEQWEYACRAFSSTRYHCGDDERSLNRFAVYSSRRTEVPGQRRSNAWGLYNMHGNVWEWCKNYIHDYKTKKKVKFSNAHKSYYKRSIRGGNFIVNSTDCRSATRNCLPDTSHGNMLGFRVIRLILDSQLVRAGGPVEDAKPIPAPEPAEEKLPEGVTPPEGKTP